jgi:hypothetical protein
MDQRICKIAVSSDKEINHRDGDRDKVTLKHKNLQIASILFSNSLIFLTSFIMNFDNTK